MDLAKKGIYATYTRAKPNTQKLDDLCDHHSECEHETDRIDMSGTSSLNNIDHARSLFMEKRFNEASELLERMTTEQPDWLPALELRGMVAFELRDYDRAVDVFRHAARLAPNEVSFQSHLGKALIAVGNYRQAVSICREVTRKMSGDAYAWRNLGLALFRCGRFDEGQQAFEQALMLVPSFPSARFNLSYCQLLSGNLLEGWKGLEVRRELHAKEFGVTKLPNVTYLKSDGEGKTLIVDTEQGYGDSLQFIRYAPLLVESDYNVIIRAKDSELRILQTIGGSVTVESRTEEQPGGVASIHCL